MSSVGSDEAISASKIAPLDSEIKRHVPHADSHGVVGTDEDIEHSRIAPLGGGGLYQHPLPHATVGAVGRNQTLAGSKIEPLRPDMPELKKVDTAGTDETDRQLGLDDEMVDTARVRPLGEMREELI